MDNFILNITKNYYAKFIYFADSNSFLKKEVENLFNIKSVEQLYSFIDNSNIFQVEDKDTLENILDNKDYTEENKTYLLNYFQVKDNPVHNIDVLNNVLPFNYVNTLVIDKTLLKNAQDFFELRKEIKHIESFLYQYSKNKALNNLSIIFINNNTNSGQYHRIKDTITVKANSLNPSSLYHEFFHLLDNHLAKIYNLDDLFSNKNIPIKQLKLLNQLIGNLDNYIKSENKGKETFSAYYNKYLGSNFEKEIRSVEDIYSKIRNIKYVGFKIVIDKEKIEEVDILAKEMFSHIEYIKKGHIEPKRNLYAIFSDIIDLDLPMNSQYIARTSEKLARIYQSSFPIDKESLFPLGEEKRVLTTNLLYVLNKEIKPLLQNSNSLSKIIELRENFNNDIKKGIKNAL